MGTDAALLRCSTLSFTRLNIISNTTPQSVVMSANVFEEQGIQFKVICPDMYGDVLDFLWDHFFPEEPLLRSMGVTRGPLVDKYLFPDVFNQNCSIAAVDSTGNI